MVLTLRKQYTQGIQFDLNYTLSESEGPRSTPSAGSAFSTYGDGGYGGFLINSWDPESNYRHSDFDVRHR